MRWIIVGLGNTGSAYEHTRHNVGRDIVDAIAHAHDASFDIKKIHRSLIATASIESKEVVFVLPETFMNDSGRALVKLVKSPEDASQLVVVYDDMDLPLGKVAVAWARGAGGHNGLKSIMEVLHTRQFLRVRVGIAPVIDGITAKPRGERQVVDFVLGKWKPEEREVVKQVTKRIVDNFKDIITLTRSELMNKWNA